MTNPFLLVMEDWFRAGLIDRHPHRGIETVIYIIEDFIEHYETRGIKVRPGKGDAMWLTTGRGLIQNERAA